jgi:NAD(P)H-dependent FMN reductase
VKILAVIGSPRREKGRTHEVVSRILAGARSAGAETETLYLIDEEPRYCVHCGYPCFQRGDCTRDEEATARSQKVDAADALVIGAPVYVWQPSGLTANFFDKLRMATGPWNREPLHGRPALGIAVAGGTGTGVFPALQSIYGWLCLWTFRPLDPLPVTRFNMDRVLEGAEALGARLARRAAEPFAEVWKLMQTYDRLPYMGYGRIDEFRWLAEQIASGLEARGDTQAAAIQRLLDEGRASAARGDADGAAQRYVHAYRSGAEAW